MVFPGLDSSPALQVCWLLYNSMPLEYIVHQCSLKTYTPVILIWQAIESSQSNKPDCPFSPPGWRQGPIVLVIVFVTHFFWMRTKRLIVKLRSKIRSPTLFRELETVVTIFLQELSLLIAFPCILHTVTLWSRWVFHFNSTYPLHAGMTMTITQDDTWCVPTISSLSSTGMLTSNSWTTSSHMLGRKVTLLWCWINFSIVEI